MKIPLLLQKINGVVYVMAGVDKFFYLIEDVKTTFITGAAANSGTILEPLSSWFLMHDQFIARFVGIIMVVSGLIQFMNRTLVVWASLVQVLMLINFVLFLHRGFSLIWIVDGLFMVVLFIIIRDQLGEEIDEGYGVAV